MKSSFNLSKQHLLDKGWTEEILLERMQNCRKFLKEAKENATKFNRPDTLWTYRYLFICQYLGFRRDLRTIRG